jgi:hypothetical protein
MASIAHSSVVVVVVLDLLPLVQPSMKRGERRKRRERVRTTE